MSTALAAPTNQELSDLIDSKFREFREGTIVKGTILEIRPQVVLVDIGYKSEGAINGNEFDDIKAVKVGDEIDVLIERLEDKEGNVILSKEKAEFKKNWDRILIIAGEGTPEWLPPRRR